MKTASGVVRQTAKMTCKNSSAKATQVLRTVAKAAGVSLGLSVDQERELASLRLVHAAQVAGLAARRTSKMTASAATTAGAFLSLSTPPAEAVRLATNVHTRNYVRDSAKRRRDLDAHFEKPDAIIRVERTVAARGRETH
jgi:hypothetical protein